MKPSQPNTKLNRSSQPPPSGQTHQQKPLTIIIPDDSATESDVGDSAPQSEANNFYSQPVPENQLGLDDWELRHYLQDIPEVPAVAGESQLFEGTCPTLMPNLDTTDCKVQVNQNKPVEKDDIPVETEIFLSSDGQVSIFV